MPVWLSATWRPEGRPHGILTITEATKRVQCQRLFRLRAPHSWRLSLFQGPEAIIMDGPLRTTHRDFTATGLCYCVASCSGTGGSASSHWMFPVVMGRAE